MNFVESFRFLFCRRSVNIRDSRIHLHSYVHEMILILSIDALLTALFRVIAQHAAKC